MICNCYFYGRQLVAAAPPAGVLVETHGNQCALVVTSHAPCRMDAPDWTKCVYKILPEKKGAADAAFWMPTMDLHGHGTSVVAVIEPVKSGQEFEAAGVKFRLTLEITRAEFRHTRGIMHITGKLDREKSLQGFTDEAGMFTKVGGDVQPGPEYTSFWRAQRLTP